MAALAEGSLLAHYRLAEKIGAGGMGEVWRATDTTLGREVAVKLLPATFAGDPDRLARFEREARLLASLNHPNIAAIFGLHEQDGVRFLAMELVPGTDLAQRLQTGPLPPEEAAEIGRQIAEALEAAHDQGVIHRDLKPANVVVTPAGQVKVLDFGLAKALAPDAASGSLSMSPTITATGTVAGVILGTAAYMSPEQAKGKAVDRRADVWAFGALLFEMLTGRIAFKGETISETLAAVMMSAPDLAKLPVGTPPALQSLLRRCLEKDPRRRLRDIGEARVLLEDLLSGRLELGPGAVADTVPRRRGRVALLLGAGIALGMLAGALSLWSMRPPPPLRPPVRFRVPVEGLTHTRISPDGRMVAWAAEERIWVRRLDGVAPRALAGGDGARSLFWSPDSRSLGYIDGESIWKVPVEGGERTLIAALPGRFSGGAGADWGANGEVVFATGSGGIFTVADRGGDPVEVVAPHEASEGDLHEPHLFPGGRGFLFLVHRKTQGDATVGSGVDTIAVWANGARKEIARFEGQILRGPCYSASGHILYRRRGDQQGVWALPFSLDRLEATGTPFLVAGEADWPSESTDGTLVAAYGTAGERLRDLVWVDRAGTVSPPVGRPMGLARLLRLSPDGKRVAFSAIDDENTDVWVLDLARGSTTRLTIDPSIDLMGGWESGGEQIVAVEAAFSAESRIVRRRADGTGEVQVLHRGMSLVSPRLSPDGQWLVFTTGRVAEEHDLWRLRLGQPGAQPEPIVTSPAAEDNPQISPDGRLLAYQSDESGKREVYLVPFPEAGGKWPVSIAGGWASTWRADGREIYFLAKEGLYAVDVEPGATPRLGRPHLLFQPASDTLALQSYSPAADGQRFLIVRDHAADVAEEHGVEVVQNWWQGEQR